MASSLLITFSLAVLAAWALPGWEFGNHFFPYTFLAALLLAWGAEVNALLSGIFFALLFELFLGLRLGVLPLVFLAMMVAYILLQRPIDLKAFAREGWSLPRLGLCLVIGLILWILGLVVSWGVLELVYSVQYPFSTILDLFAHPSFYVEAVGEIAVFLTIMALAYRRRTNFAY